MHNFICGMHVIVGLTETAATTRSSLSLIYYTQSSLYLHIVYMYMYMSINTLDMLLSYARNTVRRKFLTGENIDEFDEFSAIRQYFPYQNFPFS